MNSSLGHYPVSVVLDGAGLSRYSPPARSIQAMSALIHALVVLRYAPRRRTGG